MRIAKESLPSLAALSLAALLAAFFNGYLALCFAALLAMALWFFRDPDRSPPPEPDVLVSPADGKVIKAEPHEISIFLNLLDVHVCRSPVSAKVERVEHRPGRFLAAYKDEAQEHNERVTLSLAAGERRFSLNLVAGLVARRIVCKVVAGQTVHLGERVGLIQFGSRVDLTLPPGCLLAVRQGQRVVAGETVIARLPPT
jgi:phosphatidylserine decarboxylase